MNEIVNAKIFVMLILIFIPLRGWAAENQATEHYVIKLYITPSTTYDMVPSDLYVDRDSKVITINDSGKISRWKYSYVETVTHNTHFKYDYYHITEGRTNINRIVISKRAEVREKTDGNFYYRIVLGDKTYLASKVE